MADWSLEREFKLSRGGIRRERLVQGRPVVDRVGRIDVRTLVLWSEEYAREQPWKADECAADTG